MGGGQLTGVDAARITISTSQPATSRFGNLPCWSRLFKARPNMPRTSICRPHVPAPTIVLDNLVEPVHDRRSGNSVRGAIPQLRFARRDERSPVIISTGPLTRLKKLAEKAAEQRHDAFSWPAC